MYNQIDSNKRKTWILISLFTIIIVGLGAALGAGSNMGPGPGIAVAVVIATIMNLVGYFKGDSVALATAGAKPIKKSDNPRLFRQVENLAITAGIPTPAIYVINDPAANAFATGRDPEHASIGVTTGLLEIMDDQELEGVLAHEMSHVMDRHMLWGAMTGAIASAVSFASYSVLWAVGHAKAAVLRLKDKLLGKKADNRPTYRHNHT